MSGTMKQYIMAAEDHLGRILHAQKMQKIAESKAKQRRHG